MIVKNSALTLSFTLKLCLTITAIVLVVYSLLNQYRTSIQAQNIDSFMSQNIEQRLMPHRVNRLDKLDSVISNNINSAEIDVLFQPLDHSGYFEVGHDEGNLSGVRLDAFLELLNNTHQPRVWLDIKNLNDENVNELLFELIRLDKLYSIRQWAIIESGITSESFNLISSQGFHTSYYLPTSNILDMLHNKDTEGLHKLATQIQLQIDTQMVSAVSFNLRLYPFVCEYLEPLIPGNIEYHTWNSIKLWQNNALEQLQQSSYFENPRIKTILIKYWHQTIIKTL